MNFPLISSGSSQHPYREKTDLLPQPSQGSSPPAKQVSAQPLYIKGFSPIGNTRYIDVEFQEITDPWDLADRFTHWPDYRFRNAFSQYHNTACKNRKNLHTIDLYA